MSKVTKTYEVWDGEGTKRLTTDDYSKAAGLVQELHGKNVWAKVHSIFSWPCQECGATVENRGGRDEDCPNCGACYNSFGQRLRDDWKRSLVYDDGERGDLECYELAQLAQEAETGEY